MGATGYAPARSHASKPEARCDVSQNGLVCDCPQRHSAIVPSGTSKRLPSASTMVTGPVTL